MSGKQTENAIIRHVDDTMNSPAAGGTPKARPESRDILCRVWPESHVPSRRAYMAPPKLAQEHIVRVWGAATGCPISILRFQNVYGVGQSLTNPYTGVLSLFARLALAGESLPVYEDGKIVRDFVFVSDAAAALAAALGSPPKDSRTLDIGSGVSTTIGAVASLLADIAHAPTPHVTGQFRDGDVRAASCRVDPAAADLGYVPAFTIEAGLTDLVEWVRKEICQ